MVQRKQSFLENARRTTSNMPDLEYNSPQDRSNTCSYASTYLQVGYIMPVVTVSTHGRFGTA